MGPRKYTGKMMLHCHRLEHEDQGMMGIEYVHGGECVCDSLFRNVVVNEIVGNDLHLYNITRETVNLTVGGVSNFTIFEDTGFNGGNRKGGLIFLGILSLIILF